MLQTGVHLETDLVDTNVNNYLVVRKPGFTSYKSEFPEIRFNPGGNRLEFKSDKYDYLTDF